ncbi:hypothetical protein [Streptomyces sp. URMC 123]|uniref:hypothetical protein n=1 Tax=Streptomyces sp. URMC 123 TaxID=3423403 RepID=UPI003F1B695C
MRLRFTAVVLAVLAASVLTVTPASALGLTQLTSGITGPLLKSDNGQGLGTALRL